MTDSPIVGVLGPQYTYSDQAWQEYSAQTLELQDVEPIYVDKIEDIVDGVEDGSLDYGFVPWENSTTQDRVTQTENASNGTAVQEWGDRYDLRVEHVLAANGPLEKEEIETVRSHPEAGKQCKDYLATELPDSYRLETRNAAGESYSTAGAAESLDDATSDTAAICSPAAADAYDLEAVDEGIQDEDDNTTTFTVLYNPKMASQQKDLLLSRRKR